MEEQRQQVNYDSDCGTESRLARMGNRLAVSGALSAALMVREL